PTPLTSTLGNGQVVLSWTGSPGATNYNVYRGTISNGESLLQSGVTNTAFTDTGLTVGTIYYYKVSAVNRGGESSLSNETSQRILAPAETGATDSSGASGSSHSGGTTVSPVSLGVFTIGGG